MSMNDRQADLKLRMPPIPPEYRIPDEVLDQAVIKALHERDYGVDKFETPDWEYVRVLCGPRYIGVPPDTVRRQGINRRKKGVYGTAGGAHNRGQTSHREIKDRWPSWYRDVYLNCLHWLTHRQHQLDRYRGHCALCYSTRNIEVHHSHYVDEQGQSILYREKDTDTIPLCRKCHKKHHKSMNLPPENPPLDILSRLFDLGYQC
jgi:hypothetical protein